MLRQSLDKAEAHLDKHGKRYDDEPMDKGSDSEDDPTEVANCSDSESVWDEVDGDVLMAEELVGKVT